MKYIIINNQREKNSLTVKEIDEIQCTVFENLEDFKTKYKERKYTLSTLDEFASAFNRSRGYVAGTTETITILNVATYSTKEAINLHDKIRSILISYNNAEHGDCIISELAFAFNCPTVEDVERNNAVASLKNYIKAKLDYTLEDDGSSNGGTAYMGETLGEFIETAFDIDKYATLTDFDINKGLKQSGIMTIEF